MRIVLSLIVAFGVSLTMAGLFSFIFGLALKNPSPYTPASPALDGSMVIGGRANTAFSARCSLDWLRVHHARRDESKVKPRRLRFGGLIAACIGPAIVEIALIGSSSLAINDSASADAYHSRVISCERRNENNAVLSGDSCDARDWGSWMGFSAGRQALRWIAFVGWGSGPEVFWQTDPENVWVWGFIIGGLIGMAATLAVSIWWLSRTARSLKPPV